MKALLVYTDSDDHEICKRAPKEWHATKQLALHGDVTK